MKLSIVVPAHNEEKRIGRMLDAYLPYFSKRYGLDVEFIVVLNACTDGTKGVIESYAERFPCLRSVEEPVPGKGKALIRGFGEALGEVVGFVDADGSTPPAAFQDLADNIGDAGAIIASRWRRESIVSPRQPLARRIASRVFNLLVRILFGLRLTDTQCGAKLVRGDALRAVLPSLGITRWAFDLDLLFQLRRMGYVTREIPTEWHDVTGSNIAVAKVSGEMFVAIVRLRLLYSPFKWVVQVYDTIGRWVRRGLSRCDDLLRHTAVLFVGMMVVHVCNLGYQMVVSRVLPAQDYALLAAFLGALAIVSRPLSTLGTGLNHYTSLLVQTGRMGDVKRLLVKWILLTGGASLVLSLGGLAVSRPVAVLLHLDRVEPVTVAALTLPALFILPVVTGAIQGVQFFGWSAIAGAMGALSRLGLGAALVLLLYPACGWALLGHAGGMYVTVVLTGTVLLRCLLGRAASAERLPSMRLYLAQTFFIQISYALLMTADVLLVKHYLPEETGFAYAATLARMVVFLPAAVAAAMFPKVVSAGRMTADQRSILLRCLTYTAFFAFAAVAVCWAAPGLLLRLLLGVRDAAAQTVWLTRWMALVMAFSALLNIVVQFLLAQRRFGSLCILGLSAVVYFVSATLFHATVWQIVLAAGGCNLAALFAVSLLAPGLIFKKSGVT